MTDGGDVCRPAWVADLVHQGQDAVAAFTADGVIVYANPAVAELLGHDRQDLIGRSAFDLIHPADLGRSTVTVEGMAGGARPLPGLIRLRRADGTFGSFELTLSPVDTPRSDPRAPGPMTAVTIRDVSFQDAHWRFLTALTAGLDLHACFTVLAEGLSTAVDGVMGIGYDDDGARRSAGPAGPVLCGVTATAVADRTPGTPWATVLDAGGAAVAPVEDLPQPWRSLAAARGAGACVAVAVEDPDGGTPALIVQWPTEAALARILAEALVRRPRQAVSVALDRRASQRRLEHLAHHDPLTGLLNRTRFFALLAGLRSTRTGYGVLYVDLDRFKPVNDRLGHAVGDRTLVECARRIVAAVGSDAAIARIGGDEFAVALPGIDPQSLEARAADVVAAMARPITVDGRVLDVGASVGAARTDGRHHADTVVAAADAALYRAKREGRSTWRRAPSIDGDPSAFPSTT